MPARILAHPLEQVVANVLLPGFKFATGVAHKLHSLREANLLQIPLRDRDSVVDVRESNNLEKETEQCLPIPGEHVERLQVRTVPGMSYGELSNISDGNGA